MILTKEKFEAGLKSKKYISKAQCLLFGIPFYNNKTEKKNLIGKEISDELYKRFLELKLKPRTKTKEQKLKSFNENILCPNFHKKTVDINMLIEFSKENKNLEEFIIKMKYSDFLKTPY